MFVGTALYSDTTVMSSMNVIATTTGPAIQQSRPIHPDLIKGHTAVGTNAFREYFEQWIRLYGTQGRLAEKIGLTDSAFSRGLKREGTFGFETLLAFCEETGEPVDKVLRIAGKSELADRLARIYGSKGDAPSRLAAPDRELLELWREIPEDAKRPLVAILKGLAGRVQSRPRKVAATTK